MVPKAKLLLEPMVKLRTYPFIGMTTVLLNGSALKLSLCSQLINIAHDRFLQQLVIEPTRITGNSENILGLLFSNNSSLVSNVEVIPGMYDHETVYVKASLRSHCNPVQPRKNVCYKKADQTITKEKEDLIKLHQEMQNMSPTSTEGLWSLF